jgi:hypothetical protein
MDFLVGLIVTGLIVGLILRKKGDSFTDTLQMGCSTLFWVVLVIVILVIVISNT